MSEFAWTGDPQDPAKLAPPPSSGRRRPSSRILVIAVAFAAAVAGGLIVALSSGSGGPSEATFRAELTVICKQTRAQTRAVGAPVGNTAATLDRFVAIASTMVDKLAAVQPPTSNATAYRAFLGGVGSEISLLSRVSAAMKASDAADVSTLEQELSTVSATVDQDAKAAGVSSGCNSSAGGPAPTGPAPTDQATIDSAAKDLARTAQIAALTYAKDRGGSFAGLTSGALRANLPMIQTAPGSSNAYVSSVKATDSTYTITVTPASGPETFSVVRVSDGAIEQSCTPQSGVNGGCYDGTW